jgi:hypothetical protein
MDAYIATKPVRFDRDYAVGEIIPANVVYPKMAKRLIEWGKIQRMTIPEPRPPDDTPPPEAPRPPPDDTPPPENADAFGGGESEPPEIAEETPRDAQNDTDGTNPRVSAETPREAQENDLGAAQSAPPAEPPANVSENASAADTPDMTCAVCGKVCGSKTALIQHMKTHNK